MKRIGILYRLRCLKFIVLLVLLYPTSAIAAQKTVSVKGRSITMKQAIDLIEKNSDYTFFYNAADLKHAHSKNIDCKGTINEVLEKVFEGSGVSYMIRGQEVILKVDEVQGIQQLGELAFHDEGYFLLQGQSLALTPREQALLTVLMYRRLRPVSRQQLFEQVFSLSDEVSPESIELYIHRLRKKLQGSDVRIATLRGLGYVLERSDEVG